ARSGRKLHACRKLPSDRQPFAGFRRFPIISPLPRFARRAHLHRPPHARAGRRQRNPFARRPEMRHKVAFPLVAAVLGLTALAGPAAASHCGACAYPAQPCCPEQCELPAVRYRVCYQTVVEEKLEVCYRPVYHTVMRECRTTCYKPVYEQCVRTEKYTICKPV